MENLVYPFFMILLLLSILYSRAGILAEVSVKDAEVLQSTRTVVSKVEFLKKETLIYYAAFQTPVSVETAGQVMTRYGDYEKFIPFVSRSRYDARTHELELEGGVLGWTMASTLKLSELHEGKLSFEVIRGHFNGMKGKLVLERTKDYKTLVLFRGELTHKTMNWPPAWIMEVGGKMVFERAGLKLRQLVEEEVKPKEKATQTDQDNVPEPKRAKTR